MRSPATDRGSYGRFDESWFRDVSTIYRSIPYAEKNDCLEIERRELRTSKVADAKRKRYQRLCALLQRLKKITKASRHAACVATVKPAANNLEKNTIDVREPELDVQNLDAQQVPQHLRIQNELFPNDLVEQFWVRNSRTSTTTEHIPRKSTESKPILTMTPKTDQPNMLRFSKRRTKKGEIIRTSTKRKHLNNPHENPHRKAEPTEFELLVLRTVRSRKRIGQPPRNPIWGLALTERS
jgi:hypothetical protein